MIRFYLLQIKIGRITIDQVPEKWRASVQSAIEEESSEHAEQATNTGGQTQ